MPALPWKIEMTPCADTTSLLEKISELEESNANLKRLEDTIVRNARMFEALLGASQDGIALSRADGTIIRVIRGILGFDPVSLAGVQIADLVHRDDRESVLECYRELIHESRHQVRREARIRKPDGTYLWIEFTITDMLDDPAVMAFVHNYRDISWRKRRHLTEPELRALAEYSSTAVFSVDQSGAVQTWHDSCQRLLGYTASEIEGAHVHTIVAPAFEEADRELRSAVIENGCPSTPESTELLTCDGKAVPVELVLAPLVLNNAIQAITYIARPFMRQPLKA